MNTNTTLRMCVMLFCVAFAHFSQAEEALWGIVCPPNKTLLCTDDLHNLNQHGNAYFQGHHGQIPLYHPIVNYHLNSCNVGHITRTWTYTHGWNNYSCTQTIYVVGDTNNQPTIYWPEDVELEGCHPNTHPSVTGRPTFAYHQCAHLGYSHSDMVFTVSPQCKKIVRRWTVIDWCIYNSHNPHVGKYTYTQTIKISENSIPEIICPGPIVVNANNCHNGKVEYPPLELEESPCGGTYHISNNSPFSFTKGADLSGVYPVGKTTVKYIITYGCGYKRSCSVDVIVKDNKAPTPICLSKIAVALMPVDFDQDGVPQNGMVEVFAKRFDFKSMPACNRGPLRFSFTPDPKDESRIFSCDEVGENKLKIYVIDSKGNSDFCDVILNVQNNAAGIPDCVRKVDEDDEEEEEEEDENLQIAGHIYNESGVGIEGVKIELEGLTGGMVVNIQYDTITTMRVDSFINHSGALLYFFFEYQEVVESYDTLMLETLNVDIFSDGNGSYTISEGLEAGNDYIVSCVESDLPLQSLSAADADRLLMHLLGMKPFTKAAQYLAADMNLDGQVNLSDLEILINLIMGETVDKGHDFEFNITSTYFIDEDNPAFILNEKSASVLFEELNASVFDADFLVVQLGKISSIEEGGNTGMQMALRSAEAENLNLLEVYPNPYMDKVNFNYYSVQDDKASIRLFDVSGKLLEERRFDVQKGYNQLSFTPNRQISGVMMYQFSTSIESRTGKLIRIQ
jgi:hypothetical protein